MKLKLRCTLKLKPEYAPVDIAEDINLIDINESMSEAQISVFFDSVRDGIKRKYVEEILKLFEVQLTEIS